jgi:glycosyltransferase involved in cell wall biosynthesis
MKPIKDNNMLFILPLKGTAHGAKVIFREIYKSLQEKYDISLIDTAQAKASEDYGSFRFSKVLDSIKIFFLVGSKAKSGQNVLMNMTPHGFAYWRDLIILFILVNKKANVTIHIHANGLEKKYNWLSKKILNGVKTIVINSNQQEKLTHSGNIFLLENTLPDFKVWNLDTILKNRKMNRLLFISNLSTQKGFYRLLEISDLLKKHLPDFEVHVYGNILEKSIHSHLKTLPSTSNILYKGVVSDMDKKSIIYSEATALLFLSDKNYEVFPLVYIEALMHGLPIVTTPQHVAEAVVKENGIIIENENDSTRLLSFLTQIFNERQSLIEYSKNSYSLYESSYSFAGYIKKLIRIIEQ